MTTLTAGQAHEVASSFTFFANKFAGVCFYCAKRVAKGVGACWKDGRFHVAHTSCLSTGVSAGKAPVNELARSGPAWVVRQCREVLRGVTLDAGSEALDGAVAALRRILVAEGEVDAVVAGYVEAGLGQS